MINWPSIPPGIPPGPRGGGGILPGKIGMSPPKPPRAKSLIIAISNGGGKNAAPGGKPPKSGP